MIAWNLAENSAAIYVVYTYTHNRINPERLTMGVMSTWNPALYSAHVARVFRIWGDLEIAHRHFQDPETAQPSGDGWAVTGFWAISRWAKGDFRILNIGAHRYTFT